MTRHRVTRLHAAEKLSHYPQRVNLESTRLGLGDVQPHFKSVNLAYKDVLYFFKGTQFSVKMVYTARTP